MTNGNWSTSPQHINYFCASTFSVHSRLIFSCHSLFMLVGITIDFHSLVRKTRAPWYPSLHPILPTLISYISVAYLRQELYMKYIFEKKKKCLQLRSINNSSPGFRCWLVSRSLCTTWRTCVLKQRRETKQVAGFCHRSDHFDIGT